MEAEINNRLWGTPTGAGCYRLSWHVIKHLIDAGLFFFYLEKCNNNNNSHHHNHDLFNRSTRWLFSILEWEKLEITNLEQKEDDEG